jgi:hypothetical protein
MLLLLPPPLPPCAPLANRESSAITHTKWRSDLRDKERRVRHSNFVYDVKKWWIYVKVSNGVGVDLPHRN